MQLETIERLEPAILLYMLIAWRVLFFTMVGRECPELPCTLIFDDAEWQAVYIVANQQLPPKTPPTLNDMIRMIASLGGFLNRKAMACPALRPSGSDCKEPRILPSPWSRYASPNNPVVGDDVGIHPVPNIWSMAASPNVHSVCRRQENVADRIDIPPRKFGTRPKPGMTFWYVAAPKKCKCTTRWRNWSVFAVDLVTVTDK